MAPEKGHALYERLDREADTCENYLKRPKGSRDSWQATYDLWQAVESYACFIKWARGDRVAMGRELQNLAERLRAWEAQHPDRFNGRNGDPVIVAVCELVRSITNTLFPQAEQDLRENRFCPSPD